MFLTNIINIMTNVPEWMYLYNHTSPRIPLHRTVCGDTDDIDNSPIHTAAIVCAFLPYTVKSRRFIRANCGCQFLSHFLIVLFRWYPRELAGVKPSKCIENVPGRSVFVYYNKEDSVCIINLISPRKSAVYLHVY